MKNPTCTIEGCGKEARTGNAAYCPMHYHRWYRHGDPHKTYASSGITVRKSRRYRRTYRPGHPVADRRGNAYKHRVIYYDHVAGHDPQCAWCGKQLEWSATTGQPTMVHVDHINGDILNNNIDNLTASCPRCNPDRGKQERYQLALKQGFWSSADTLAKLTTGRRAARHYDITTTGHDPDPVHPAG